MFGNDDYIFHIKKLLETQRFIFCSFVSNQVLIEQFDTFLESQKLFLDQDINQLKDWENDNKNSTQLESSNTNEKNLMKESIYDSCKEKDKLVVRNENDMEEDDTKAAETPVIENGGSILDPIKKESIDEVVKTDMVVDIVEKSGNEMNKTDEKNKCDICDQNFKTENILFQHYSKEHDIQKEIACPAIGCPAVFRKFKSLNAHARVQHKNENIFECRNCGVMFNSRSELRYHKKTSHDVKLTCIDCGLVFASKTKLRDHRKETHPAEKPYSCLLCPIKFLHESSLETHKQNIHERTEKYVCDICNKAFLSKSNFKCHIETHSGEKNFSCEFCDKKFYSKSQRNTHKKFSHVNIGRYQCDQCEYTCSTNGRLKIHMTKHNDSERNFSCIICGALFKTDYVRKNHEQTHKNDREKKHRCDECPQGFHSITKLNRHKKIHTGEMEFSCSFCDKRFNQSSNLKTHIKKYHKNMI